MAWRTTTAGVEYGHPSAERGVYVDGPLSAEDLKCLIADLIDELCEQTKRENDE